MTTKFNRKSTGMQTEQTKPLLESFAFLFYICKFLGINSQDWKEFRRYKNLKKSPIGEALVIVGCIISFINFNLLMFVFQSKFLAMEKTSLIKITGVVLCYCRLFLFMSDRIMALLKQRDFSNIFDVLQEIDEDLGDLNIILNNNCVKYQLAVGMFLATLVESSGLTLTFFWYVDERVNWSSWLWIYFHIPTYFNSLDQLWYIGILIAIRKRFEVINNAFSEEAFYIEQQRFNKEMAKNLKSKTNIKIYTFKNLIRPAAAIGDVVTNSPEFSISLDDHSSLSSLWVTSTFCDSSTCTPLDGYNSMESKFVKFCQLHDTLCNAAKQLNEVYAFPIFTLMGCSFSFITAQLYFYYCARAEQVIPSMFRVAKSGSMTAMYFLYMFLKCIRILYENWLAHLESKKTGICIHRCALADDKNETYHMINHLSLKLFNHQVNFNACGYFPLNMTTLFSFCGGITTYLILLIQFNLEGQQVKFKSEIDIPRAVMQNDTHQSFIQEDVVNGTRTENITSLLSVFHRMWNNV